MALPQRLTNIIVDHIRDTLIPDLDKVENVDIKNQLIDGVSKLNIKGTAREIRDIAISVIDKNLQILKSEITKGIPDFLLKLEELLGIPTPSSDIVIPEDIKDIVSKEEYKNIFKWDLFFDGIKSIYKAAAEAKEKYNNATVNDVPAILNKLNQEIEGVFNNFLTVAEDRIRFTFTIMYLRNILGYYILNVYDDEKLKEELEGFIRETVATGTNAKVGVYYNRDSSDTVSLINRTYTSILTREFINNPKEAKSKAARLKTEDIIRTFLEEYFNLTGKGFELEIENAINILRRKIDHKIAYNYLKYTQAMVTYSVAEFLIRFVSDYSFERNATGFNEFLEKLNELILDGASSNIQVNNILKLNKNQFTDYDYWILFYYIKEYFSPNELSYLLGRLLKGNQAAILNDELKKIPKDIYDYYFTQWDFFKVLKLDRINVLEYQYQKLASTERGKLLEDFISHIQALLKEKDAPFFEIFKNSKEFNLLVKLTLHTIITMQYDTDKKFQEVYDKLSGIQSTEFFLKFIGADKIEQYVRILFDNANFLDKAHKLLEAQKITRSLEFDTLIPPNEIGPDQSFGNILTAINQLAIVRKKHKILDPDELNYIKSIFDKVKDTIHKLKEAYENGFKSYYDYLKSVTLGQTPTGKIQDIPAELFFIFESYINLVDKKIYIDPDVAKIRDVLYNFTPTVKTSSIKIERNSIFDKLGGIWEIDKNSTFYKIKRKLMEAICKK